MATVHDLMEMARGRMEEERADAAALGAVYKFILEGSDGGTFMIDMVEPPAIREADETADCTIRMKADDFVRMIETKGDPRQYLFMGKLKVDGNIGLAIKLRKFTDMFR